ncbi:MAG: hypothetical protein Q4C43_04305 [Prevotella sp.]|nr:hypothetical protein [Prevotella sp.]
MRYLLFFILGIAVGICIMSLIPSAGDSNRSVIHETVVDTVIDTVEYPKPVLRDSVVVRHETRLLPTVPASDNDTAAHDDSAEVVIPITQKIYEDSTYKAYISGYDVALDSISVYHKTVTIRERELITKHSRVGWGIVCGAGYGRQGFSPYIGIGVYYRLGK